MKVVSIPSGADDEEVIARINRAISKMTEYGTSGEVPKPKGKQGYFIEWSNGHKSWCMGYYSMNKPECYHRKIVDKPGNIYVDSGTLLVVGVPKKQLERIVNSDMLDTCPLYYGSYEARAKGEANLSGIGIPPALKSIQIETGREGGLDVSTHKLLEDKFRLN